ncbi:MAG TPA: tetratricopeptide repeat protein, partial [Polyangia bacterium]|nr:tetratricopeptide repeat protein [Polyangia bacterium]
MGIFDRIAGTFDELARDAVTPADAREEIALSLAFAERGDLALADERLRDLVARFPKLATAHAALGAVQAQRDDVEAAIASYGRAVDRDGDDARHWFALGTLLGRARRFEPARDAFRKTLALSLDGDLRGQAHAALGQLYAGDGQPGRAARELEKALALRADDPALMAAFGRVLAATKDPAASGWLARAARAEDGSPALFVEAADAAGDDGAAAQALLREGLGRAPTHPGLRAALARRLAKAGRREEGLTLALESLRDAPDDAAVLAAVREASAAASRWSDALAAARREAELGAPPVLADAMSLALGAQDRDALAAIVRAAAPRQPAEVALVAAARAFLDAQAGRPSEADVRLLARHAPDEAARRFVVRRLAPPPAP